MSRQLQLVLLAALLALPCSAGGQALDSLPSEWRRTGPPEAAALYELKLDPAVVHGGETSLRIRFTGSGESAFGTVITQSFSAEEYRGKRVRLSGYARTSDATGMARLWVRVDGSAAGTPFDNMSDRALSGTTPWQRCDLVVDVPADSKVIHIGAIFFGEGVMWIDDLQFEAVDASLPVTAQMREPQPSAAPARALSGRPLNLGFERRPARGGYSP